jgi:hypothetical protein
MRPKLNLFCAFSVAAAVVVIPGCGKVDCGDGTYDENGSCKPVDTSIQIVKCGLGFMVKAGQCVPDKDWVQNYCGANTKYDDRTSTCVGTGTGPVAACTAAAFKCGAPAGNSVCISGQAFSGPSMLVNGTKAPTIKLKTDNLAVNVYDPIAFVSDPVNTKPLASATTIDDDGCFIVSKVDIPFAGFFAVAVEDVGATKNYARSSVGLAATYNTNIENTPIPTFDKKTIDVWSVEVGGDPLDTAGSLILQYSTTAKAVAGLVPTQDKKDAPWAAGKGDVFYFGADTTKSPVFDLKATNTSAIGAVLVRKATVTTYGGNKADCTIAERLAGAAPGVILYVLLSASGSGC